MEKIKYNEKEYLVSDRVRYIISELKIDNDALEILNSNNYQQGKIPENILLLYLIDSHDDTDTQNRLMLLLTSKIYGKGLISYDVVSKFSTSYLPEMWETLDDKYTKGIITDEMIKLICKLIEDDDEYLSENNELINNIATLLSSKEYEYGRISEETIKLMAIPNDLFQIKTRIISEIIEQENLILIKDEIIKLILEIKNEVICSIIYHIIGLKNIGEFEKENYILAMLNIENQENLLNVYNSYIEKNKKITLDQFARNFVSYTLPLLQCGLAVGYTRKKQKEHIQ